MTANENKQPLIHTNNLGMSVIYGDQPLQILNEVSIDIYPGESVAIVGSSGSGKTTLLGLLAGMDVATSGEVLFDGQSLTSLDEEGRAQLRAQKVGFVFQSFQLLPALSALENVMLPLELKQSPEAENKARALLEKVGLSHRLEHSPLALSGGEQQRVAVARAFACEPKVLFADEPTGNLDTHTGELIIDLLFDLNKGQDTTLVLVTHDMTLAKRCDRIIELNAGEVVSIVNTHSTEATC